MDRKPRIDSDIQMGYYKINFKGIGSSKKGSLKKGVASLILKIIFKPRSHLSACGHAQAGEVREEKLVCPAG